MNTLFYIFVGHRYSGTLRQLNAITVGDCARQNGVPYSMYSSAFFTFKEAEKMEKESNNDQHSNEILRS